MEAPYEGFNDLNDYWTKAEPGQIAIARLEATITGSASAATKAYDISAGAEMRWTNEVRLDSNQLKMY